MLQWTWGSRYVFEVVISIWDSWNCLSWLTLRGPWNKNWSPHWCIGLSLKVFGYFPGKSQAYLTTLASCEERGTLLPKRSRAMRVTTGCWCSSRSGDENQASGETLRNRYHCVQHSVLQLILVIFSAWQKVLHHEYSEHLISKALPSAMTSRVSNTVCPSFKGWQIAWRKQQIESGPEPFMQQT